MKILTKTESGMSLVELLVAMAVGLVLVSGVVSVMVDSKDHFYTDSEVAYIQENARYAIDQLSYDIRMAGYFGCAANVGNLTNTLVGSTSDGSISSNGIKGFEYSELNDTDFPADIEDSGLLLENTDIVVINRGNQNDDLIVRRHRRNAFNIQLEESHDLEAGAIMVIASPGCRDMTIFQMSGTLGSDDTTIVHETGTVTPGNCHRALSNTNRGGSAYDCDSPPATARKGVDYPNGSSIMRFVSHAYFVGTSDITGLPTLFRMELIQSGTTVNNQIRELVSGVENMQLIYGVDTDEGDVDINGDGATDGDGQIDRFYTADQITLDRWQSDGDVAWNRVLATRISLTMRSANEISGDSQTVTVNGVEYSDRYLRQPVTITAKIRNRGLGVTL